MPLLLRDVPLERASAINRAIPFAKEPNPAARPFRHKGDKQSYERALECLTTAIYYEGAKEPVNGQLAIAQVVLNRVRHPAFPSSICDVVYEGSNRLTGCQFSFTCDGSLRRVPDAALWARSRTTAKAALAGGSFEPIGYATHYHADYVVPYWATSLAKNAVVGTHIFYRWPGTWGRRAAFVSAYLAKETDPSWLRAMALARWRGAKPNPHLPKVSLKVGVDPRVELISIIHFLARGSPPNDDDTPYAKEVRARFARYSSHVAVLIYRQLSNEGQRLSVGTASEILMHYSPTPQLALRQKIPAELAARVGGGATLAGFINAVRDFAKQSAFDQFFRSKNSFYLTLASKNQNPAVTFATQLQNYAGMPIGEGTVLMAPLMRPASGPDCLSPTGTANSWFVVTSTTASGAVRPTQRVDHDQASIRYALASRIIAPLVDEKAEPRACAPGRTRSAREYRENQDLILAVMSRVEALSRQQASSRGSDISLAKRSAAMVEELKLFEISRDRYPTLRDFYRKSLQASFERRNGRST